MNRRNLLRGAGIMGAIASMPVSAARAFAGSAYPLLQAEIDKYVDAKKVAGMMAAIGRGTQPADYLTAGTLALDSNVPVGQDTLWRVYSMTKPVTGMAAMILVDDGTIELDQPIADFIPEFADMTVLTDPANSLDAVPAEKQITVRNLLTHTAGLGYNIITKGPLLGEYNRLGINPAEISKTPTPGLPQPAPTPPIDEFARRVASLPLIAEPGTKWSYSIGLDVMGYVIQVASGVEFGEFLKSRIFGPLGMMHSYFTVPARELSNLTTNYFTLGGALIPIDPPNDSVFAEPPAFPYGGAGLVTTAYDYDRFLAMLLGKGALDGNRIMSAQAVALGMSNLLPEGLDTSGSMINGEGFGAGGRVGLGERAGTYGWGGAAGTVAFADSVRNIRASGYTQYVPANAYGFQSEFAQLVYQQLAEMAKQS